ncbi:hypothetical protein [Thermoplasma sp.]|nr:hypothetical protein [Thermoplasma sp.]
MLKLAAEGVLKSQVMERPLSEVADVLKDLKAGKIEGRAVLKP